MFRQSVHACFSSQEQDLTNAVSAYEITSKFGLHSLDQHPVLVCYLHGAVLPLKSDIAPQREQSHVCNEKDNSEILSSGIQPFF